MVACASEYPGGLRARGRVTISGIQILRVGVSVRVRVKARGRVTTWSGFPNQGAGECVMSQIHAWKRQQRLGLAHLAPE